MPGLRALAVHRAGGGGNVASAELLDGPNCKDLEIILPYSHFGGEAEVQGGGLVGPGPPRTPYPGPFPAALGRFCSLGLIFPFCHHHHNHQYFTWWHRHCWLDGGLVGWTRLLDFSKDGAEV